MTWLPEDELQIDLPPSPAADNALPQSGRCLFKTCGANTDMQSQFEDVSLLSRGVFLAGGGSAAD